MRRADVPKRSGVQLAAAAAFFFASSASASPTERAIHLSWIAPPGCPAVADVRADLDRILGRDMDAGATPAIDARADAEQEPSGAWRLRISVVAPGNDAHERVVEGETCAEIAEAAKVIVALASGVDPGAAPKRASAEPPASIAVASWSADRTTDTSEKPSTRSPRGPTIGLRAAGGADAASLPSPTPGFEAGALLRIGATQLELTGGMWLHRRAVTSERPAAGGDVSLAIGGVRLCRAVIADLFELRGCGGLEAGVLSATGFGVPAPGSGHSPWVAPMLGIGGGIRMAPRVRLALDVEGLAPLVRDEFALANVGDVYRAPPVTGRALFGIDVDVW